MEDVPDASFLSKHSFFKSLAGKLPTDTSKTRSLIVYGQDALYSWNQEDKTVHSINVKRCWRDCDSTGQVIVHPKPEPLFDVEGLELNTSCTLLALTGSEGVCVLKLSEPRIAGQSEFPTKAISIAQRLFLAERRTLRHFKWHPGSPSDSHLVILTSDEVLRCYDVFEKHVVWKVTLSRQVSSPYAVIPNRISLGDTPVSFDFAPPAYEDDPTSVKWPIVILWGNGDIYWCQTSLLDDTAQIQGPLLMFPHSDDNYGSDASSILVLHTSPPIVVLSTYSGTLYHSLVMPLEDSPDKKCLLVVESVEIDLAPSVGDEEGVVSSPIHLLSDCMESSRYFCIHKAGIHSIVLPLVGKLHEFASVGGNDFSVYDARSIVDNLLCTGINDKTFSSSPILGCTLVDISMSLFVLLSSGSLVGIKLLPKTVYSADLSPDNNEGPDEDSGFLMMVDNLIKEGGVGSQPMMKLPFGTSAHAWLELLLRISHHIRSVVKTHETIKLELEKRVVGQRNMTRMQSEELDVLLNKKVTLQEAAEQIAEKFEEMQEKQNKLMERLENVLKNTYVRDTALSIKEKNALDSLKNFQEKLKRFDQDIVRLKSTEEYQRAQCIEKYNALSDPSLYLDHSKCKTLREHLSYLSSEIVTLLTNVKDMKKKLEEQGLFK